MAQNIMPPPPFKTRQDSVGDETPYKPFAKISNYRRNSFTSFGRRWPQTIDQASKFACSNPALKRCWHINPDPKSSLCEPTLDRDNCVFFPGSVLKIDFQPLSFLIFDGR